jgi:DNA-binding response OmpR family regulator
MLIDPVHSRRAALRAILTPPLWDVCEARTFREAIAILDDLPCGVAIWDTEVPDGNWQGLLRNFECRQNPPKLVVSSRVADDRLWAEVLNLGGYDVLAQPFDPGEVLRVTRAAGMAWHRSIAQPLARCAVAC